MGTQPPSLRVAIVGSGPSGFFCADYLLRLAQPCTVSMFERWPTPFGLVRGAVAPDHQNIRAVVRAFAKIAEHEDFSFFGNVEIGRDVGIKTLTQHYDAVIITTGASLARPLDIEGEDLPGCTNAGVIAGWYNGRLDCVDAAPDLSCASAVVIGAGNAALDMARMIATPPELLVHTDISSAALKTLRRSALSDIHVVARRGPFETRFLPQELALFADIPECVVEMHGALEGGESGAPDPSMTPMMRAYDQIEAARARAGNAMRRVHFHFYLRPHAILGQGKVSGVLFQNRQDGFLHIPGGLVIAAVGHAGRPLTGLPFDPVQCTIPNQAGRIIEDGEALPGLYTAGWIKRGAAGVIGTNKPDCRETVQCVMDDRERITLKSGGGDEALRVLLARQGLRVVTYADWLAIDAAEKERGQAAGKPRDPLLSVTDMLAAAFR